MAGIDGISIVEHSQSVPENLPKGRIVPILEIVERRAGAFSSSTFWSWVDSQLEAGKVVATYALDEENKRRVKLQLPEHLELSPFSRDGILRHLPEPAWRQLGDPALYERQHS